MQNAATWRCSRLFFGKPWSNKSDANLEDSDSLHSTNVAFLLKTQISRLTEGCYVDFFDKLRIDSYLEKQLLMLTFCFFALNVGLIVAWPPKTICENYKGK